MVRFSCLCLAIAVALGASREANAEPDLPRESELKLTVSDVVVFKDGYCLIVKQGLARTDAEGRVFTEEVPDSAILGSFWAIPEEGRLKSTVAGWHESETRASSQKDCTSLPEMIAANLGSECSFNIGERIFRGTIHKLLTRGTPVASSAQPLSSVAAPGMGAEPLSLSREEFATADYFVLRTESGDVMVACNSVQNLTVSNMRTSAVSTLATTTRRKRLTLTFEQKETDVAVTIAYFRPDVRWIPTYRIQLSDEKFGDGMADTKAAEIAMQGEILNEAENLIDAEFHLVVGVPNFRFRSLPSPLTLEPVLRTTLAQVAPALMQNQGQNSLSNGLFSQRASEFRSVESAVVDTEGSALLPEELSGKGSHDLFVYSLGKLSLVKGERAAVPILTATVAYRDVYTWDATVIHAETHVSPGDSISPLVLSENRVWRQVELVNSTNLPWTTGAAMFVDGQQPLAQELLTFTSPGGTCRVPVTVAVDLQGSIIDRETSRELSAMQWRGSDFARVKGEIDLSLINKKSVPVRLEINLRFGGKPLSVSDDGQTTLSAYRATDWLEGRGHDINNSSSIIWKTEIRPGESCKPKVEYEFWLYH